MKAGTKANSQSDIDYDNQTSAEVCWLAKNLPDLKTETPVVSKTFDSWIAWLVDRYSIDGLRIDSVKDVNKASMPPFCEAADVYCLGELANNDPNCQWHFYASCANL